MRSRTLIIGGFAIIAALVLAACGDGQSGPDPDVAASAGGATDPGAAAGEPSSAVTADVLDGSSWTLRAGGGPDGPIELVDGWPITLTFDGDSLGGTAACNGYGGGFSIDDRTLRIDDIGSNAMGCEPGVALAESRYFAALFDVDAIDLAGVGADGDLTGAELALAGPATELVFVPVPAVDAGEVFDRLWLLEAITIDGEETAPRGEPATLLLRADGTATGSTGCRDLDGRFIVTGGEILLNEFGAEGECPASLAEQDGHVVSVLGDGFVPVVDGDTLTVTSAGNQQLRYVATTEDEVGALASAAASDSGGAPTDAEALDGVPWTFLGGDTPDGPIPDPRRVDPEARITLVFTDVGTAYGGDAICNAYRGEADVSESLWRFSLGQAASTRVACGPDLDPIAAAYLNALPRMTEGGFQADGRQLVMNGDGIELLFEREDASS
ncbi:MAG: META domain-containing protein [Actinomycetota bacterium]